MTEPVRQRTQGFQNLIPVGRVQFLHPLLQAGVEVDPHSLPVKGRAWPDARALLTSAFTAL